MQQTCSVKYLTEQDRLILESAERILNPKQPDIFDFNNLSIQTGIDRRLILDRFPFPELLAVGIIVMVWEEKLNATSGAWKYRQNRPNGFKLNTSIWEPDPELLNHFYSHPLVQVYRRGEPPLRLWFRKARRAQCV